MCVCEMLVLRDPRLFLAAAIAAARDQPGRRSSGSDSVQQRAAVGQPNSKKKKKKQQHKTKQQQQQQQATHSIDREHSSATPLLPAPRPPPSPRSPLARSDPPLHSTRSRRFTLPSHSPTLPNSTWAPQLRERSAATQHNRQLLQHDDDSSPQHGQQAAARQPRASSVGQPADPTPLCQSDGHAVTVTESGGGLRSANCHDRQRQWLTRVPV